MSAEMKHIVTSQPPTLIRRAMLLYAKGATADEAARKAGVPIEAFNLYRDQDNFSGDLRKVLKGLVADVYAPRAFAFLHEVVCDSGMAARVRVDAAKALLDRSGYVAAPLPAEPDPTDITLLSRDELTRLVIDLTAKRDDIEARLAAEAKDVSPPQASDDGAPD
jgi:hypothetical protein